MPSRSEERLRLPWTGEFTPGQLGDDALEATLLIVSQLAGDRDAIVEAIRSRWFAGAAARRTDAAARLKQQQTRAGNVVLGMQSYGLVDKTCQLTELGEKLLAERDPGARAEQFVKFLLTHRRGLELLDVVRELKQRGVPIKSSVLRAELRRHGYTVTTNSGDAGKLRQWLATADVVDDEWEINESRVEQITGTSLGVISDWQTLTRAQKAFLATILRLSTTRGKAAIPSRELLDFVREEHGPIFDEGQVRKIYNRLHADGWIEHDVKTGGRGGKGGTVSATDKLMEADFDLLVRFDPGSLPADLRAVMTMPLEKIYEDLAAPDSHTKGIALELLAVNLAVDLGLTPLRLRVRGVATGGAEVDLIAEGAHLWFSRWLFQCKNTRSVGVTVLAKEVGMATLLQAHVIVIATTGIVSKTVSAYARRITETTPFQVVLIDGKVLKEYRARGAMALRERFRDNALTAVTLKRAQVLSTLDELADDDG